MQHLFGRKQVLHVTGDRVIVQTEVGTSSGNFLSVQVFLGLDDDVEDMVMGVQLYNSVLSGSPTDHIKILDAKIRELTYENSIVWPRFSP